MDAESQPRASVSGARAEESPGASESPPEHEVFASLTAGDTRELARLVRDHALSLGGDDATRRLRAAFVTHRYAWEVREWKRRWRRYWKGFMLTTLCTSALGVATSGIVAATSGHARSLPVNIVLIVIGALVAVLSAVNQLIQPRPAAMEYRRDQFAPRGRLAVSSPTGGGRGPGAGVCRVSRRGGGDSQPPPRRAAPGVDRRRRSCSRGRLCRGAGPGRRVTAVELGAMTGPRDARTLR